MLGKEAGRNTGGGGGGMGGWGGRIYRKETPKYKLNGEPVELARVNAETQFLPNRSWSKISSVLASLNSKTGKSSRMRQS